jgi:predicted metalloendopeptidase
MKLKLSPFTILFLLLNSILIFCASRKVDTEKKTSSAVTLTNAKTHLRPGVNIDANPNGSWVADTKIPVNKVSYSIGYIIDGKIQEEASFFMKASANNDFAEESAEQKTRNHYGAFRGALSRDRTEISSLGQIKIDAISNYKDLAN